MKYFPGFLACGLLAVSTVAAANDGTVLEYTVLVRLREGGAPLEGRLRLATTPPVAVHNKVKRPRFVGWTLKAMPGKGAPLPAAVLTRLEGLMYLEGPASGLVPRSGGMRFGNRSCRLWQALTPPSVGAFVYLVEVAPNLLALSYLSASLPEGSLTSIEMHLDKVALAKAPAPAAEGTVLLRTLRQWGVLLDDDQQVMETDQIQ